MQERRPQFSAPPVKVGEELTLTIEGKGEQGDGVGRKQGFVLFVPGTDKGDEVKVRVTKVFKKVGFAEVIGRESASSAKGSDESSSSDMDSDEDMDDEDSDDNSDEDSEDFGDEE